MRKQTAIAFAIGIAGLFLFLVDAFIFFLVRDLISPFYAVACCLVATALFWALCYWLLRKPGLQQMVLPMLAFHLFAAVAFFLIYALGIDRTEPESGIVGVGTASLASLLLWLIGVVVSARAKYEKSRIDDSPDLTIASFTEKVDRIVPRSIQRRLLIGAAALGACLALVLALLFAANTFDKNSDRSLVRQLVHVETHTEAKKIAATLEQRGDEAVPEILAYVQSSKISNSDEGRNQRRRLKMLAEIAAKTPTGPEKLRKLLKRGTEPEIALIAARELAAVRYQDAIPDLVKLAKLSNDKWRDVCPSLIYLLERYQAYEEANALRSHIEQHRLRCGSR
jgi:multidrug efflux pump subunit AcrB